MSDIDNILDFWFGAAQDDAEVAQTQETLWWKGLPETDRLIEQRFGKLRRKAIAGELDVWLPGSTGRLAAILLVDQFSRNIGRGKPEAFAHDALARGWCLDGLALRADRELRFIERVFFYLPLEHSESRKDQAQSVSLYEALVRDVPAELRVVFEYYAGFARAHRDVIERFGRFPHRNAVLGRTSTAEELGFLQQPGSSF